MPAVVVGGVTIPVAPGGISRDRIDNVDRARRFDNSYAASQSGTAKRDFHFSTPPVSRADADVYEAILASVAALPCLGDIIGASSNLLLESERLDQAAWTKSGVTIAADSATAPNGTETADKLAETTATSAHYVSQVYTGTNTAYSLSAFLKASSRSKAVLALSDNASGAATIGVDLSNGTLFATGEAVGNWITISSGISREYGGWYRAFVTGTRQGAGTAVDSRIYNWKTSISYAGDLNFGVSAWGAQLQESSFVSAYSRTTTAGVASLTTSCFPEVTGWTPVKTADGYRVVLGFALHEA